MTRKLASIRTIDRIDPIDNADRIEIATIDGWEIIIGKNTHQAGEQVIYLEIDSAIPVNDPRHDEDGTLAKRGTKKWNGTDCHILRTVRLRGVYSQGLILPLSTLTLHNGTDNHIQHWARQAWNRLTLRNGTDVSKHLGITKYDRQEAAPAAGNKNIPSRPWWKFRTTTPTTRRDSNLIAPFPIDFARKSDSERVQNLGKHWEALTQHPWYATEKIDGQSVTLINDNGNLRIASRNWEVGDHPAKQWALLHNFLEETEPGTAVQGEWAGPGVQGNRLALIENTFFTFGQFNNGQHVHLGNWARPHSVPTIEGYTLDNYATTADLIDAVNGIKSTINPDKLAEGIVFHHANGDTLRPLGDRSTFKAISNKWLIKADN